MKTYRLVNSNPAPLVLILFTIIFRVGNPSDQRHNQVLSISSRLGDSIPTVSGTYKELVIYLEAYSVGCWLLRLHLRLSSAWCCHFGRKWRPASEESPGCGIHGVLSVTIVFFLSIVN